MSSIEQIPYRSSAAPSLDAPEPPDPLIPLTPVHYWVWLVVVAVVVVAAALWSIFGTVTQTVERSGVLTRRNQQPEAITYVSEDYVSAIHLGQPAQITLDMTGELFTGQVTRVALSTAAPDEAAAVSGNDLLGTQPIYEIRIALNSAVFTEGAEGEISILTDEMRPISRALPLFS